MAAFAVGGLLATTEAGAARAAQTLLARRVPRGGGHPQRRSRGALGRTRGRAAVSAEQETPRPATHAAPALLSVAVLAGRRRRCRPRVTRAADSQVAGAAPLGDKLDANLRDLQERENALIERIEKVQQVIDAREADLEGDGDNEAELAEEEVDVAAEAASTAEATPKHDSPISKEEGELLALQELGNLQQLANVHEDTTQKEIKALENALAGGDSRRKLDRLREAGRRLSAKVKFEFNALLKREEKLLSNIEESRQKINDVEKEPDSDKVVKELQVLEDLADDYKDTTAKEIKALEALAKAIK